MQRVQSSANDDIFYLILQKQKIGAKLHIPLERYVPTKRRTARCRQVWKSSSSRPEEPTKGVSAASRKRTIRCRLAAGDWRGPPATEEGLKKWGNVAAEDGQAGTRRAGKIHDTRKKKSADHDEGGWLTTKPNKHDMQAFSSSLSGWDRVTTTPNNKSLWRQESASVTGQRIAADGSVCGAFGNNQRSKQRTGAKYDKHQLFEVYIICLRGGGRQTERGS
jgi:hypothetical protein